MDNSTYRLVFSGELIEGKEREQVQQQLSRLFKKSPEQLEALFDGNSHVLKRKLTLEQAESFRKVLESAGVKVDVEATTQTPCSEEDVIASFEGTIEPVRITPLYQLAMAGVTLMMLLIPLIYAAIIGISGYGIFYHAVHNTDILSGGGSGRLLLYLTPIVVGGILVLFMLKPFLLFRPEKQHTIILDPEQEPKLFAFVQRICDAVGARYPTKIQLDNQVNASASFYRGLRGLFTSELVLTIGAPLVAGMNMRQLGGILAHEFGHFSQAAAMRMSYLINWVNHWLYRAVYQRDMFDEKLERWAAGGIIYTAVVLQAARFFVWLTRRLLWLFMQLGGLLSSLMSRQMEFDADRYEARLAGSEQFANTSDRLNELSFAAQQLHDDQYAMWNNQSRLLENFPAATAARAATFTEEAKQRIAEIVSQHKADVFDTHPPHAERIASASREECPGIFRNESPASMLFSDFEALSRNVTLHFYRHDLELTIEQHQLMDSDSFDNEARRFEMERSAVLEFFLEMHSADAPNKLEAPLWSEPLDIEATKEQWNACCMRQRISVEIARETLEEYDKSYNERMDAMAARSLLKAGFSINAEDFGLPVAYITDAENVMEHTRSEQQRLLAKLQENTSQGYARLTLSLGLLRSEEIAEKVEDVGVLQREVDELSSVQRQIVDVMDAIIELRHHNYVLLTLLQNLANQDDKKVRDEVNETVDKEHALLSPMLKELASVPFPFDHSDSELTLAGYLYSDAKLPLDPYAMHQLAEYVDDNLRSVLYRILGRLCSLALQLEHQFGLQCKVVEEASAE